MMKFSRLKSLLLAALFAAFALAGCQKEIDVYEVEEFHVQDETAKKGTRKTSLELISIAYNDLYGVEIGSQELSDLMTAFESVGDKAVMTDRIIRNFLNDEAALIPERAEMEADYDAFVTDAYKQLYGRRPGETELLFFRNYLSENEEVTPRQVYYAMMTADEYLYY